MIRILLLGSCGSGNEIRILQHNFLAIFQRITLLLSIVLFWNILPFGSRVVNLGLSIDSPRSFGRATSYSSNPFFAHNEKSKIREKLICVVHLGEISSSFIGNVFGGNYRAFGFSGISVMFQL